MKLKFFEKKEELFLILDIGTEAVKSVIIQKRAGNKNKGDVSGESETEITALAGAVQYFEKYGVFEDLVSTFNETEGVSNRDFEAKIIKKAVLKSVEEARKNLFFTLTEENIKKQAARQKKWQVLLGISPDKFKGRINWQVFVRKNFENKISKKEQDIIYKEVLEKAKKEISQDFAREFGILQDDIRWVFLKILEKKIDGYIIPELCGYQGKNLELKILATFLPKNYLDNIKKILESLKIEILEIVHLSQIFPYLYEDENKNGIYIDVGGEITQFFLIENGSLQQIGEFDCGGKKFSEALSQKLTADEETARNLKERYSNGLLSPETASKLKDIFVGEQNNWYLNLENQIKKITRKGLLFENIYLFGGGSLVPEIKEILEKKIAINLNDSLAVNLPTIEFVYPKDLKKIRNPAANFKTPQHTPSLLICYQAL